VLQGHAATPGYASCHARAIDWRAGLWAVISAGLLYGLLHAVLRLSLSTNLPQDDVTANILAQTLELGYLPRQPPLYEWLLWSVQRFTGPTLPSFLLIKYTLLTATFGFLYLIGLRVFSERRWAVLAALSPLLIYQIGWNLHEGVTHTMAMVCALTASFWAFIRVAERGRTGDYVLFGILIGLGLISKWSFAAFLIALSASAMLQPRLRHALFDPFILISVATAIAVASPAIYWVVAGKQDLASVYGHAVAPMAAENRLKATLIGLKLSLFAPLAFLFPLDAILVVLFPRVVPQIITSVRGAFIPQPDSVVSVERLILHMTIAGVIILILGALLTGATHYLERYMHPFFLLTPIWLVAMVERIGPSSLRPRVFAGVLLAATATVLPLRLYDDLHAMGQHCQKCRVAIPYDGLAQVLSTRGFQQGTIIAQSRHDAGNLRRYFPLSRISCLEAPRYAPPLSGAATGQVAIVLNPKPRPRYLRDAVKQARSLGAKMDSHTATVTIPWQPWPRSSPPRNWSWEVSVADVGSPQHELSNFVEITHLNVGQTVNANPPSGSH
jgi:hypothetical protein